VRSSLANRMTASAINVRGILHRRALGAAILTVRISWASAIRMCAFLRCFVGHFSFLSSQGFAFVRRLHSLKSFGSGPVHYDASRAGNVSNNSNHRKIQMEDWQIVRGRKFNPGNLCALKTLDHLGPFNIFLSPLFSTAQDDLMAQLRLRRSYAYADCNVSSIVIAVRYIRIRSDCEFAFDRRVLVDGEGH
jgi:hypothetical protein